MFWDISSEKKNRFFISYKWNEISEDEANRLCKQLALYQINPIRDKYNLEYGDSIVSFMNSLKECDGVILIICEEYFFSINCMYEGITAMKNCKKKSLIRLVENSIFTDKVKRKCSNAVGS